jgi:hypothetical protein
VNRAGRILRLWASLVLTHTSGWIPPGFHWRGPHPATKCYLCTRRDAILLADHVVVCGDLDKPRHAHLLGRCPELNMQCQQPAVRGQNRKWLCKAGHEYAAPMCSECWGIGVWVRSSVWTCVRQGHQFEAEFAVCVECQFGYLVSPVRSNRWFCEFCGKEYQRRGR